MASARLSEDLSCSICLSLFTEPVVLPCGHSFCRDCVTAALDKQPQCPHCRQPTDTLTLTSNHMLRTVVDKVREAAQQKQEYLRDKERAEFLCPEHEEKMKLFCITDQQLICVICRDSHKHERHSFKPVSEAAVLVKTQLEGLAKNISEDTKALETLVKSQQGEICTTKQRSKELQALISSGFENMYTFLQKKEKELMEKVTHEEAEALQKMTKSVAEIKAAKAENQKLQETVTAAINITDPEGFLKMWSGQSEAKAAQGSFRPKSGNFRVEKIELSLDPYESHLQMFVWKEMVQVLKLQEERLSLKSDQTSLSVSQDQSAAVFCRTKYEDNPLEYGHSINNYSGFGHSINNYSVYGDNSQTPLPTSTQSTNTLAGRHYWEVYVGAQCNWELGVSQTYLKYTSGSYQICSSECNTSLNVQENPRKVGLYLNCPRKELSFYNADTMTHMHTASLASTRFPVSAHFGLGNTPHNPLVVCTY